MKLHLLKGGVNPARVGTLSQALRDLDFHLISPSTEPPKFHEPVLIIWTREFDLTKHITDDEIDALVASGRLISVLVEKRTLPDDLPKHPVVDLTSWRGSPRNAFFLDLLGYLEAAVQSAAPPPPRGPLVRFVQRLFGGLTVSVLIVFALGFALNLLELQNNLCSINFIQPTTSDFCGKYGLGGKPTQDERVAWEARDPASCEALSAHINRFGDTGELYERAGAMLLASTTVVEETWLATRQSTVFSQSISSEGTNSESLARAEALSDAFRHADAGCRAFAESDFYRFIGSAVEVEDWDCFVSSRQHYCGFDGVRTCELEQLNRTTTKICGPIQ